MCYNPADSIIRTESFISEDDLVNHLTSHRVGHLPEPSPQLKVSEDLFTSKKSINLTKSTKELTLPSLTPEAKRLPSFF